MADDRAFEVQESTLLLPFLLAKLPGKGRNKVKGLLTHRQVKVDGKVVTRHDVPLSPGQTVTVSGAGGVRKEALQGIRILHEDDDILVIDKPTGLLSMATDEEREHTAYHILMAYVRSTCPDDRVFIVHRLDRETSGVMMFAKSESVQQALQEHWKDTVQERLYVVAVEGEMSPERSEHPEHPERHTVKTWLKENKVHLMYVSKPGDGVPAVTHYRVLRSGQGYSLLEVELETGRKNQIRVHMQSIGHSVVGDKRYGAKTNPIGRLALHARVLSFRHPVTGEVLRFETGIPAVFQSLFGAKR